MFGRNRDPETQVAHAAKGNSYNFIVVFFAALGSFTYGFNSSIIGAVFGLPEFFLYYNISLTGPNANEGNQIIGGAHPVTLQVSMPADISISQRPTASSRVEA